MSPFIYKNTDVENNWVLIYYRMALFINSLELFDIFSFNLNSLQFFIQLNQC